MNHNPLAKYFRQPALYLKLPSNGQCYPPGAVEINPTGEIAVYPMTATDEIVNRTVDALLNGEAVTKLIASCVPAIKDPWSVPSVDLDAILIAIKIASYGKTLDMPATCTECGETSDYEVDLLTQLGNIGEADYATPKALGDLELYFKPLTYREINAGNLSQFNQQRLMRLLADQDLEEGEKSRQIADAIGRITDTGITAIAQSIAAIKTQEAVVDDPAQIMEFLKNCTSTMFNDIKQEAIRRREQCTIKPLQFTCGACQHKFQQPFILDMTSFFDRSS